MLQALENFNLSHDLVDILVKILQSYPLYRDKLPVRQVQSAIYHTELAFTYAVSQLLMTQSIKTVV
jgi:hypothetical protein